MKVLHAISSLNISSGGPSLSTWSLVRGLVYSGIRADIVTFKSKNPADKMISESSFIQVLSSSKIPRFAYSSELVPFLNCNHYDIYHGHGLWEYPTHAIANYARKARKPYLISPRGMLYPEALNKSALFKKLAMLLYQRKDLERATVIHATCYQEMIYIRDMGFQNPIAIIPNSIDISNPIEPLPILKTKKQVGFVGRFAKIKNLEMLLQAWADSGAKQGDWELVLIGDGDSDYKNGLIQLAKSLGIENLRLTGFLSGKEKEKALKNLDYLVLPSKSENFGMVVAEALLREIPVIASKGTPWEDLQIHQAGWWVNTDRDALAHALEKAMGLSEEARQLMGANGKKLVEKKYSIEGVAEQMIALYQWILKKGDKPDFVYE